MHIDSSQIVMDQINLLIKCQELAFDELELMTIADIAIAISIILEKHNLTVNQ